jgi:hypothetical protein
MSALKITTVAWLLLVALFAVAQAQTSAADSARSLYQAVADRFGWTGVEARIGVARHGLRFALVVVAALSIVGLNPEAQENLARNVAGFFRETMRGDSALGLIIVGWKDASASGSTSTQIYQFLISELEQPGYRRS